MRMPIPEGAARSVLIEALRRDFGSQWLGLTQAVAWVAAERGYYVLPQDTRILQIDPTDVPVLREHVRQLVAKGLLSLGTADDGATWRSLVVTDGGRAAIAESE